MSGTHVVEMKMKIKLLEEQNEDAEEEAKKYSFNKFPSP